MKKFLWLCHMRRSWHNGYWDYRTGVWHFPSKKRKREVLMLMYPNIV